MAGIGHGTELDEFKGFAVQTGTLPAKQHRRAQLAANKQCEQRQQRREQQQPEGSGENVERALEVVAVEIHGWEIGWQLAVGGGGISWRLAVGGNAQRECLSCPTKKQLC